MDLDYGTDGKFVAETEALLEVLEAEGVMLIVLGSTKGSGCCCQLRAQRPRRIAADLVGILREIANSIEHDLTRNVMPDENNGHEKEID